MKRSELFFNFILVPLDLALIVLAFISSYFYRAHAEVVSIWTFQEYFRFILYILPFWLVIFTFAGLYNYKKRQKPLDELASIIFAVSLGIMLVVAWIFLSRTFFFSRLVIIYAWIFSILFVAAGRFIMRFIQTYLYKFGVGTHKLVIIGTNEVSDLIIKEINSSRNLGYKLIGIISTKNNHFKENSNIIGSIDDFEHAISRRLVDDVILTDSNLPDKQIVNLIDYCQGRKINFKQIPNMFQVQTANVRVSSLATVPIIEFYATPLDGWGKILKRFADLFLGIISLIIFSPFIIISAIILKFDSPGPVFYKNERVGENGRKFLLYKLRTMKIEYCTGNGYGGKEAENFEKKLIKEKSQRSGPVYKVLQDPRRTKFGRFLEKTSIDELPQFFNVIIGNMSLVGPRPHQPREVEKYDKWHEKVLRIKPGITGMAQISGRSDLDFDDEARLDIYYIENWSLWMDIKIIIKTPLAIIKPRKNV